MCRAEPGGYRRTVRETDRRPLLSRPLRRGHLVALDAAAAVAVSLLCAYAARETAEGCPHEPVWVSWLVALVIGLPVSLRRLRPLTALGIAATGSVTALVTGVIPLFAVLAPTTALVLVLYEVALSRRRRTAALALGACLFGVVVATMGGAALSAGQDQPDALVGGFYVGLVVTLPWAVGRAVRERRAYAARSAGQLARQAVAEERLRIARELHDVVAHSMGLIVVKASIANHVADSRPEEARDALRVIEETGRTALGEMRNTLGRLRSGSGDPAGLRPAELRPAPGLDGLPELVDRAAMAGVGADLEVSGTAVLPEGVGLSVYRIVQEALTNVVKHAAPARCRVTVELGRKRVRIEVTDNGPGVRVLPDDGATGQGHGLIGMRERAMMYGGSFSAGPRPEGGFRVSADLPYEAAGPTGSHTP
ncbi:sensor histidine kinase [Actinomadura sp. HBU206391]|nr:sensor histidine kinase [Actinomadura sp. HBU206391]